MITGRDLLKMIEEKIGGFSLAFSFPFMRVIVRDAQFEGLSDEEREQQLASTLSLSMGEVRALQARLFFRLFLLTPEERDEDTADVGYFWLRTLAEPAFAGTSTTALPTVAGTSMAAVPTVLHFYGYKGGQARSLALAQLSRTLANDGWRVLCIDMDAEAPSLEQLFGVRAADAASSMVGLRAGLVPSPVRAHTSRGDGLVDLLAFRPSGERYDLDAAALAMEAAIYPPAMETLIQKVQSLTASYSITLVDHRTGLAASVPPWVNVLPGPVIVFARLDGQWRLAKSHFRALWSANPSMAGIVVTFKPDDEPDGMYRERTRDQRTELLEELAAVKGSTDQELDPEDIADHIVVWPFDRKLGRTEAPGSASPDNGVLDALSEMRRLMAISHHLASHMPALNPSGARDEGDLIQTRALRDLSSPNNSYTFVLGRKGTGKTRLVRELSAQGIGEPLMVAEDDKNALGIPAGLALVRELEQTSSDYPEQFWWTLIAAALQGPSTERGVFQDRLRLLATHPQDSLRIVQELAKQHSTKRDFLIDGLETAFTRTKTFAFAGALVRVISTTENDPALAEKIRVRVFARTDLAERGFENFEQQTYGTLLRLNWETRDILNFALSRIRAIDWFRVHFEEVVVQIENRRQDVLEGKVNEDQCDEILLQVFPSRLRRLNLNMTTFLRTYFSDDPTGRGSYYPRIYDEFLRVIGGISEERRSFSSDEIADRRVSESLITFAHEAATKSFLSQVKAELRNLVALDEDDLQGLLQGLRGTQTPFVFEARVREIAKRTRLKQDDVREALQQMKTLGMFEDRPRHPNQWRVGRLFKSSLGMKYVRG